ncbi:MAG: putative glycoside hydrolase, partial [Acidimicrobiia bacterium]
MRKTLLTALAALLIGACSPNSPESAPEPSIDPVTGEVVEPAGDGAESTTSTIPSIQLIGRVVDTAGVPVSGATISVSGMSTTTAPDGFYSMEVPQPGVVTAVKPGWLSAEQPWDGNPGRVEIRLEPITVRALRVAANAAGDPDHFQRLLDLADQTAVNALVFDTKVEGGLVLYDTSVEMAYEIGAVSATYDPTELIARAREHGLYTITRIVSFDDAIKAAAYPDQAIA